MLGQSPHNFGLGHSRWWLAGVQQVVPWLHHASLSGIWRLLRRLGLHYKRGREYIHSPDPDYDRKLGLIRLLQRLVRQQDPTQPARHVLLYEDEFTYYRQPTRACDYVPAGSDAPRACRSQRHNRAQRIAATVNLQDGRVVAQQRSRFNRRTLIRYFRAVEQAYPQATVIWIVLDNWPVHFHPDLLAALAHTRIRLIRLPTYAPWTNPVEKFWRKLYQEVLHLHPFSDDWTLLHDTVQHFLDRFANGSEPLRHELGLLDY